MIRNWKICLLLGILVLLAACEELALHEHIRELIQLEPILISHDADAEGFSDTNITVTLTSDKAGADIRFTTDQEDPTEDTALYSGPIIFSGHNRYVTLKARAFHPDHYPSPIVSQEFHIVYSAVQVPILSPSPGELTADTMVTITSPTVGATIRYTINGTAPTASSPVYSGPIPVSGQGTTMNIKAFAAYTGLPESSITEGTYTVNYPKIPKPVLSPLPGTYATNQSITITTESGSTIYYTTDGSDPKNTGNSNRKVYSGPISINGLGTSLTLQAYGVKPGRRDSDLIIGTYSIQAGKTADPGFSVSSGTVTSNVDISVTSVAGATVYYTKTTNGSTPPMPLINEDGSAYLGEIYTGPISLTGDNSQLRITAVARAPGLSQSDPVPGNWTVDWPVAATPLISPSSSAYNTDQTVTIISPEGGTIYYTIDGTNPASSGTRSPYSGGFPLAAASGTEATTTVRAMAEVPERKPSADASRTLTIDKIMPVISGVSLADHSFGIPTDSRGVAYSVTVSDNRLDTATLHAWLQRGGTVLTPTSNTSGSTVTVTGVPTLTLDSEHTIRVTASDLAGNTVTGQIAASFVTGALFWSDGNKIMKGRLSNPQDTTYTLKTWYTATAGVEIPDVEAEDGRVFWIENTANGYIYQSQQPWANSCGDAALFESAAGYPYRDLEIDPATTTAYYTVPSALSGIWTILTQSYTSAGGNGEENTSTAGNPNGLDFVGGLYYWGSSIMSVKRSDGPTAAIGGAVGGPTYNGFVYYNNRVYFTALYYAAVMPENPEDNSSYIHIWDVDTGFTTISGQTSYTLDSGFNHGTLYDYDTDLEILSSGTYTGLYALIPESSGTNEGLSLIRYTSFTTPNTANMIRLRSILSTGTHASTSKIGGLAIMD